MKRRVLILFCVLLFALNIRAQDFPVGVFSATDSSLIDANNLSTVKNLGVNWLINTTWRPSTLTDVNVIAFNARNANDFISYYASGMYNKFEAEDSVGNGVVGIKHEIGRKMGNYYYSDTVPDINKYLIKGPNYHQNMKYAFKGLMGRPIPFNLKIRMRIGTVPRGTGDTICQITVFYKNGLKSTPLMDTVMKINNLSTNDADYLFQYKYMNYFNLPDPVINPRNGFPEVTSMPNTVPIEDGVQFMIKWCGNRELFIDCLELYDQEIWNDFILSSQQVKDNITNYANNNNFNSLKYWYGFDEPTSRDSYIPYKLIDSLLQHSTSSQKPLFTTFYPQWNNSLNNETQIPLFINTYNPAQFMFYYYPVEKAKWPDTTTAVIDSSIMMFGLLESLLASAHEATSNIDNGFWFTGQAHRYRSDTVAKAVELRKPTMSEFNAQAMLALSYGAKGLFFYNYYSWGTELDSAHDFSQGFVDNNFNKRDLWYKFKELTTNRLKSTLGNTLKNLTYTNSSLDLRGLSGSNELTANYLTAKYTGGNNKNFHIGFFNHKNDIDDKYFFVVSLVCPILETRTLNIKLQRPTTSFMNYRIYNVEGGYDWSYYDTTSFNVLFPAGEGSLYRVAPVVKYGGIIRSNETISSATTLTSPLTIASGATLTINNTYNIYGNITVNNGGSVAISPGATLNFYNGASLNVDGVLTANGTSSQRLIFNFSSNSGGINILSSGTANITYSNISNAYYGVRCQGQLPAFSNNIVTGNTT